MPDINVKDFAERRLSLGKMLKEKYPKAYGDLPDGFLTEALGNKYPEAYGKLRDAELGTISRPSKIVTEYHRARNYLLDILSQDEKDLYKGQDPQLIANATVKWAQRQVDRPFGAFRALMGAQSPVKGFTNPESTPDLGKKTVDAWGIKNPTSRAIVAPLINTFVDLAGYHLAFNAIPSALVGVVKGAQDIYAGEQGKALDKLRGVIASEFVDAGIPAETSAHMANVVVATQYGKAGFWRQTPAAIEDSINALVKNKGKLAGFARTAALKAKEESAKQGFTDEWFRNAMNNEGRLPPPNLETSTEKYNRLMSKMRELKKPVPVSSSIEVTKPSIKGEGKSVILELSDKQIAQIGALRKEAGLAIDGNSLIQARKAGVITFDLGDIKPNDRIIIINKDNIAEKEYILQHEERHHKFNKLMESQRQQINRLVALELRNQDSPLWKMVANLRERGYSEDKILDELFAHGLIDNQYNQVVKGVPTEQQVKKLKGIVQAKQIFAPKEGDSVVVNNGESKGVKGQVETTSGDSAKVRTKGGSLFTFKKSDLSPAVPTTPSSAPAISVVSINQPVIKQPQVKPSPQPVAKPPVSPKPQKSQVTIMSRLLQSYKNKSTDELYKVVEGFGDIENLKPEEQVKYEAVNRILNEREKQIPDDLSDEEIDKIVANEELKSKVLKVIKEKADESKIKPVDKLYKEAKVAAAKEEAKPLDNIEVTPPKELPPESTNPVVDPVAPLGVEKTDNPVQPEKRLPQLPMYQVTVNTNKGPVIAYYNEDGLKEFKRNLMTGKDVVMNNKSPALSIRNEVKLDMSKLGERGSAILPFSEDIQRVYDQIDKSVSPVEAALPDVARAILATETDKNVLKFNISQIKSKLKAFVPGPKQESLITQFIETGGEELVGSQMTGEMSIAAQVVHNGQLRFGKRAKELGIIHEVIEQYMKHLVVDPDLTLKEMDAQIRYAMSTGKISKWVASKMPRVRTESGEFMYPTIQALKDAGIKVVTDKAFDLYEYTMLEEGTAIINAELAERLQKIPYIDPKHPDQKLFQLMSVKPNDSPPRGYRLLRRGPFTMKWASPEAYNAISNIAEPPLLTGKFTSLLPTITKRFKFLLPFFHAGNWTKNVVGVVGIPKALYTILRGIKILEKPENVSTMLQHNVNLFRINHLSGGITDEFGRRAKWFDLPGKVSEGLFLGLGDAVTAGIHEVIWNLSKDAHLGDQERKEVVGWIVNQLSGNLSPASMSRIEKAIGRAGLLAHYWTRSNINLGEAVLGKLPKYWSNEQKAWAANYVRKIHVRGFLHLYAAASIVTAFTSLHYYGKVRLLHENPVGKRMVPLLYVDKRTGKEYYASNWYGFMGDELMWLLDPLAHAGSKLSIPLHEAFEQIYNVDTFTREQIQRSSDTFVAGIKHRLEHIAVTGQPAGLQFGAKTKITAPLPVNIIRALGIAVSSSLPNQDRIKSLYDFKERYKEKVKDVDKDVMNHIARGEYTKAVDVIVKNPMYASPEGMSRLQIKIRFPMNSIWKGMDTKQKIEYLKSLKGDDKVKFFKELGEEVRRGVKK